MTSTAEQPEVKSLKPPRFALLQRVMVRSLLPIGMLSFAAGLPYYLIGDGKDRFHELQALLEHGTLSAGRYSLIGPIFATPLFLLGEWLGTAEAGVALFNVLLFLVSLAALHRLLRPWMEERTLRVFLLLLLFGSMFPANLAMTFYGETFTAMFVAVGLVAAVVARTLWRRLGWAAVALGVANSPGTIIGLGLVVLERLWRTRRWRYALVGVLALGLIMGESLIRRGSIFATGYSSDHGPTTFMPFSGLPGFSYPFLFGLLAIFLSFGKGLIFYVPGLFLPMRKHLAALGAAGQKLATIYRLWLLFVAGLVLLYAPWWGWNGDWFWGPRFFLIACLPASFALAYWTQRPSDKLWLNLVALGVLALSLWVGLDSAVFSTSNLAICQTNDYHFIVLCQFTPEFSPLFHPLTALYQLGFSSQWVAAELPWPTTRAFAAFAPVAALYIAYPLLRTLRRQLATLIPSRAQMWQTLRPGWRF